MGVAAGVAVALAVVAVAVSAYAGTRSELRNRVDTSLQSLAQPIVHRAFPPAGVFGPGGGGPQGGPGGPGDLDEGLGLDQRPGQPFGGAEGTITLIHSHGSTYVPRG